MANSYNTVTVTSAATLVKAANSWRAGITLYNVGTATVYVGTDSSVTSSTGMPVAQGGAYDFNGWEGYRGDIYAITASSTADLRYLEWTQ